MAYFPGRSGSPDSDDDYGSEPDDHFEISFHSPVTCLDDDNDLLYELKNAAKQCVLNHSVRLESTSDSVDLSESSPDNLQIEPSEVIARTYLTKKSLFEIPKKPDILEQSDESDDDEVTDSMALPDFSSKLRHSLLSLKACHKEDCAECDSKLNNLIRVLSTKRKKSAEVVSDSEKQPKRKHRRTTDKHNEKKTETTRSHKKAKRSNDEEGGSKSKTDGRRQKEKSQDESDDREPKKKSSDLNKSDSDTDKVSSRGRNRRNKGKEGSNSSNKNDQASKSDKSKRSHHPSKPRRSSEQDVEDKSDHSTSDEDNDNDDNEEQQSKKRKNEKRKKDKSEDEDDSSDEDVRKINKKADNLPNFISIRDLVRNKHYRIKKIVALATSKGNRIRLELHDKDFEGGQAFIHLPEHLYSEIEPILVKLNKLCMGGFYFIFKGFKGPWFKYRFTTKKH